MASRVRFGGGHAATGLLSVAFVLLGIAALAVGLLGLIGWSWSGFGPEVAILLVGSALLGGLAVFGLKRRADGRPPWSLLVAWAGIFALMWVAVGLID